MSPASSCEKGTREEGDVELEGEVWAFQEINPLLGNASRLPSVVIVLSHHLEEAGFVGDAEGGGEGAEEGGLSGDFREKHGVLLAKIYKNCIS
jgi:hypothetical protein